MIPDTPEGVHHEILCEERESIRDNTMRWLHRYTEKDIKSAMEYWTAHPDQYQSHFDTPFNATQAEEEMRTRADTYGKLRPTIGQLIQMKEDE